MFKFLMTNSPNVQNPDDKFTEFQNPDDKLPNVQNPDDKFSQFEAPGFTERGFNATCHLVKVKSNLSFGQANLPFGQGKIQLVIWAR